MMILHTFQKNCQDCRQSAPFKGLNVAFAQSGALVRLTFAIQSARHELLSEKNNKESSSLWFMVDNTS